MDAPRKRWSLPLRLALVAAIAFATAGTLLALLVATDTALSIGERLADAPGWLVGGVTLVFAALVAASGWVVWRLLRARPRVVVPVRDGVSRDALEAQLGRIAGRVDTSAATRELEALDRRRDEGTVHVALFGEISAGKSALLRALTGRDADDGALASDVRGGTTRAVLESPAALPDGRALVLADVPGLNEAGGEARAALARAEATRAHALVYVADADLTRAQHEAFEAMLAHEKPAVLALNKSDRYDAAELEALIAKLRARYGTRAAVVPVVAGGEEEMLVVEADGRERRVLRQRAPEIAALRHALAALVEPGADALEPARQRAVLESLAAALERDEAKLRSEDADAVVARYTKRAIVGALAAVAPGTDIVIQGVLAAALLRELASIHGVSIRTIDLDAFLERAAGTVRTTASVTLAIAGNVLKAFPGIGTVSGGLVHAVAYGLIFDALGRAAAQSLAERQALGPEAAERFESLLRSAPAPRLRMLREVVREAIRE